MNVVVDTSIWVDYFKGVSFPIIDEALQEARVYTTPIVVSELLSGVRSQKEEKELIEFLETLSYVQTPMGHWIRVGLLRRKLLQKGYSVSTPDAHIIQAALDTEAMLATQDKIFEKTKRITRLKIIGVKA